MNKDQALGTVILLASIAGILVYGWLVFLYQWSIFVIQLTAFAAVGGIPAILAW